MVSPLLIDFGATKSKIDYLSIFSADSKLARCHGANYPVTDRGVLNNIYLVTFSFPNSLLARYGGTASVMCEVFLTETLPLRHVLYIDINVTVVHGT